MKTGIVLGVVPPIHPHLVFVNVDCPNDLPVSLLKPLPHEPDTGEKLSRGSFVICASAFRNFVTIDGFGHSISRNPVL